MLFGTLDVSVISTPLNLLREIDPIAAMHVTTLKSNGFSEMLKDSRWENIGSDSRDVILLLETENNLRFCDHDGTKGAKWYHFDICSTCHQYAYNYLPFKWKQTVYLVLLILLPKPRNE